MQACVCFIAACPTVFSLLVRCAACAAGDKSKEFYIILSGEVEIRTPYPDLEVVTTKRKGEYFGFSGVVNQMHTLSAWCASEVLCLVLPERKKDKMLAGVKITTDPTKRSIILGILGLTRSLARLPSAFITVPDPLFPHLFPFAGHEPQVFLKNNKFLQDITDVKKWGQLGCMWNCISIPGTAPAHGALERCHPRLIAWHRCSALCVLLRCVVVLGWIGSRLQRVRSCSMKEQRATPCIWCCAAAAKPCRTATVRRRICWPLQTCHTPANRLCSRPAAESGKTRKTRKTTKRMSCFWASFEKTICLEKSVCF